MIQIQIETILNSSLSNKLKSELISNLFSVLRFLEGGKTKPLFEEWIKTVPDDGRRESKYYDLKRAYEELPFELLEAWRTATPEELQNNDSKHLPSVSALTGIFYKSRLHPTVYMEVNQWLDNLKTKDNEFYNNHDLDTMGEYYRYVSKKKEGGSFSALRPTETISIGDHEYDVLVFSTPEERKIGLSKLTKPLKDDEGALFIFEEPVREYFTLRDTKIPLDVIFIDQEGEVIQVSSVKARDPEPVICETSYQFVLEVNINSGIQIGDELDQEDDEFSDEDKEQIGRSKMLVLDSSGNVLMKLSGGERIVSRIKTRQLIKAALKAYKSDEDKDYRRVGRVIIKELDAQDSREPQYVEK